MLAVCSVPSTFPPGVNRINNHGCTHPAAQFGTRPTLFCLVGSATHPNSACHTLSAPVHFIPACCVLLQLLPSSLVCCLCAAAGLVHLEVLYCPSLTPSGCAHLTSLTALTCLRLQHCRTFALDDGVSSDEDGDGPLSVVTFQSKVSWSCSSSLRWELFRGCTCRRAYYAGPGVHHSLMLVNLHESCASVLARP